MFDFAKRFFEHKSVLKELLKNQEEVIKEISNIVLETIKSGAVIYLCGNGGSAADAQHVAAELVGKFLHPRKAFAAQALTTNTSILSAVANDYNFSQIFERQVLALMRPGDILVGLSTSGESENVLKAIKTAKQLKCKTIGFTGNADSQLLHEVDICLQVPSSSPPRIQEMHIFVWHLICEYVESQYMG